MPSLLSLSQLRTQVFASSSDLQHAARQWKTQHAITLPRLLAPELLAFVQERIERDGFHERVHEDLPSRPVDLALNHGVAASLLALVTNDRVFLECARLLTGRDDIRSFLGRVHRRVPRAGHEDAWHDDLSNGRIAALTINLSPREYRGGVLEIRDRVTGEIVFAIANTGPGDAVLFELHERLEHRVTSPTGDVARTVYAGWFRTQQVREYFGLSAAPA